MNLNSFSKKFFDFIYRLYRENSAVTAIQYALIAALIVLVIGAGIKLLGTNANSTFNSVATSV